MPVGDFLFGWKGDIGSVPSLCYGVECREGPVPFRCGRPLSCGEAVEPLRLRLQGLKLASIPAGVGRPLLHCTVWW